MTEGLAASDVGTIVELGNLVILGLAPRWGMGRSHVAREMQQMLNAEPAGGRQWLVLPFPVVKGTSLDAIERVLRAAEGVDLSDHPELLAALTEVMLEFGPLPAGS